MIANLQTADTMCTRANSVKSRNTCDAPNNACVWETLLAALKLRKACAHLFNKANLKMVLGCILAASGMAIHALYMHRLAPSEGHVLVLTSNFCQAASYRSFACCQKWGRQLCLGHLHRRQLYTLEHALPYVQTTPNCEHSWRLQTCRKQLQYADIDCCGLF